MKKVSSIINNLEIEKEGVKRIRYVLSENNKSKDVWEAIAEKVISEDLKVSERTRKIWLTLIQYVHGDSSCLIDLDKPVLLFGNTGSGKTKTMEIMSHYISVDDVKMLRGNKVTSFNYKIFSARGICNDYLEKGTEGIQLYKSHANICIDDLGSEPVEVNHFGSKLDVISEVIEERYRKGLFTHFTTNLDKETLISRYGDRCASRVLGGCNTIRMTGEDYRLIK